MPQIIEIPGMGQVEFPDGMSDDDIAAAIKKNSPQAAAPEQPKASRLDTVIGSMGGRLALGAASPFLGVGQAGAHLVDAIAGTELGKKADSGIQAIEASKKRGMQAFGHDPESIDWMGIAGSLLPGSAIAKGVGKVLPAAVGPLSRAGVAAAQGATVSAATPTKGEDFSNEKTGQVLTGAGLGGLFSLGGDLVKGGAKFVGDAIRPLTEKGRAQILDLFQQSKVPENARQKVAQALMQYKELVPGSKPTAGELMANMPESTSLASHQGVLERMSYPVATAPQFASRRASQEAARLGEIQSFAKTPADLAAALKLRKDTAENLYGQAYSANMTKPIPKDIAGNPYVKDAMADAAKLAESNGVNPATDVTQFGHYLKIGLDKQLSRTGDGALHDTEKKAVGTIKDKLVDWLIQQNPQYGAARDTFRRMSQDPNQMQVGQVLEDALRSPLGTKERSTVFANAVNNAPNTIKKATGQRVTDDLSKILTPQNEQKVKAVMDDLTRVGQYRNLAKQSSAGGSDAIPGNVEVALPNILSRPAMIANFMMKKIGESAEEKITKEAARRYLDDPQAIANALLRQPVTSRNQQILEALMRQSPVAAGTLGGQVGR